VVTNVSNLASQAGALALLVYVTGCAGLRQSTVTGYDHVGVYFATTREYDPSAAPDHAFTNTGTKNQWINYGTAEVSVPLPHSEGTQKGLKVEKDRNIQR
jgi:hypothetical protein